jgi:hypothetical protein
MARHRWDAAPIALAATKDGFRPSPLLLGKSEAGRDLLFPRLPFSSKEIDVNAAGRVF